MSIASIITPLTDAETLVINKRGMIAEWQRDQLHLVSGLTFWYLLISIIVVVAIFYFAFVVQAPANMPKIPAYFWIVVVLAMGVPVGYMGFRMWRGAQIKQEITENQVSSINARVEWSGSAYRIAGAPGNLRPINEVLYLLPGNYRFYALPRTGVVLSAEPMDDEATLKKNLNETLSRVFGFKKETALQNPKIKIITAEVDVDRDPYKYYYYAEIEGIRYQISTKVYNAIIPNLRYRAYVISGSEKLVGLEPI